MGLGPVTGKPFGWLALCILTAGCSGSVDSDVTRSDVEKNQREFSQEAYEDAMRKAGKGAELEAEKQRNKEHLEGGQGAEQPTSTSQSPGADSNPDENR